MRRILLPLLLALAGALPAAAQTDTTAAVRPADLVRLSVWRMPEFSGDFPVAPDGTIQHPLLTEVRVVGRPREEVRRQLREVLLRYENDPQFVFDYLYRVAVTGEVRLPNLYSLPPETSLSQAIAAAGGLSEFGRINDVIGTVLGAESGKYTVNSLAPLSTVTSLATVLAVVNVILLTALATVGALLYNMCAALVGGIGVTLTDD